MNLISKSSTGWLLAICLIVLPGKSISKQGESIKFIFMPGEKISFVQKLTAVKEKDMGSEGHQLDESVSTTKITISKTSSGWDVLVEPKSISIKRNGEEIDNPMVNLLSSAVIMYKLDPVGNIVDINGYEAFIETISKQIPPQVFQQLAPVLNIDALKAKETAEWNGRIGDYLGAEVKVGDAFVANSPYQLPDGATINYNITTNIAAIEPCAGKKCVHIKQTYNSQADNVAKMSGKIVNNVATAMESEIQASTSENNSAYISGSVKRVIDPNTMLIYEEENKRIIEMKVDVPGVGLVPIKMTETRVYEFQY